MSVSLSGPEALRSLEEALRDVRREEDDLAKRVARSSELVAKFRETESELLRELVTVRLSKDNQSELQGELTQAERRARDMLEQHGAELDKAEAGIKALDGTIADLNAERARAAADLEKSRSALSALASEVARAVQTDATYSAKKAEAERAGAIAGESRQKTELAEKDRDEKGKPYRDDPLFMYLWERRWGTDAYRAGNIVTMLDAWVARLVNYTDARANFTLLNEIPLRLKEHADRQAAIAEGLGRELTALEQQMLDKAGGQPLRAEVARAEAAVAALDAEIVEAEDQRDEQAKALSALAQGTDPAFSDAVGGLVAALAREDIQSLLAAARATRTTEDDAIVQQIDDVRQRASEEEADARELRARLKTLEARRRELEDIQFEFKKQGYDRPNASFREDKLVGDMLNEFLRGGISAADYWGRWRSNQSWTEDRGRDSGFQWPDSSFGGGSGRKSGGGFGGGWSRPGPGGFGGSSSGGFSRPRQGGGSGGFRTGGGSDNSGFKTGGGF